MRFSPKILVMAGAPFLCLNLLAADQGPALKPLMTKPGKLMFSDDFSAGLGKKWHAAKGKWEAADGAVQAKELKEDHHGAVARTQLKFHDAIIEYSFKLQGSRMTTFSVNDTKEHLCRVLINPTGFTVQKDDHDHDGPDKAVVFERYPMKIEAGRWHTVLIEIKGPEMLAKIGDQVAFGGHPALDVDKANFGLTVAGESVQFKDLRVWEAFPNPGWEATKAELAKHRPKTPAAQPGKAKAKAKK